MPATGQSASEEWARRQLQREDHRYEMMVRQMHQDNARVDRFCIRHRWLGRMWYGKEISARARANAS